MNIFEQRENGMQPVWFMRQAGRYHWHYQGFRKKHSFMELCKNPELACEVTLGPIEDFKFNAAIMFSDLLFPLEQMNLGLHYNDGPPKLETYLSNADQYKKVKIIEPANTFYKFQSDTCSLLKEKLPKDVTLLGFVGAPFTLYTYATEGGHKGSLIASKTGLYDGRWQRFLDILLPNLLENISMQLNAGADAICLFDTAVGELGFEDYMRFIKPVINQIADSVKAKHPDKKIIYYTKQTHLRFLENLQAKSIDVLGIDWRIDLVDALKTLGKDYYVQGNIDPVWLHLPWEDLEKNLQTFTTKMQEHPELKKKWVAGLGHGVLPKTPEENVRRAVEFIQGI